MKRPSILLAIFPMFLIGLTAAERITTLLLDENPASPGLWWTWLVLHSTFGSFWYLVDLLLGASIVHQLLGLTVIASLVVMAAAARKWATFSFVSNHVALAAAIIPIAVASNSSVSSLDFEYLNLTEWAFSSASQMTGIQIVLLTAGTVSCLLCHLFFWIEARRRQAPIVLRIRELQQNL